MTDDFLKNPFKKHLDTILRTLPSLPGVYRYLDKEGNVIYVGKAKNLKNRVLSYFRSDANLSLKTRMLVRKIADIKLIVVNNETEALLLECNLIKKYKPKYNVMLKDDKSYPWICISNEDYPRVFTTRHRKKDGSVYYGPYPSGRMLKDLMALIRQMFRYRLCTQSMTEESVAKGRHKACLNYQMKLCDAPCVGYVSREDYMQTICEIRRMLRGDFTQLKREMKGRMMRYADNLEFEKAQQVKEKIAMLDEYTARTAVISNSDTNVEVYACVGFDRSIMVNAMKVVGGCIIASFSQMVECRLEETEDELLASFITQTRENLSWQAEEILLEHKIDLPDDYVRQTVPVTSEKKQLLELCHRNALFAKSDRIKKETLLDPERWSNRLVEQMQKDLHLPKPPYHMECFDNSNIQGNYPVASCVVFRNCKPSNREYKHFNIKTVVGANDFASMKEIVYRRYSRLKSEGKPLPDLIIVDGGKGQLSAAVESLEALGLFGLIPIIGIAKRLEEIFFPFDPYPLCIDKRSNSLKVIQHIRDEAHRFGITFHRSKRSKATFRTSLTDIEGIGDKTAQDLLIRFNSVKQISEASLEELVKCVGPSKARKVYDHYHKEY
ncbi:MAG TPA: excinuclease ABC subunit UvrC [Candidatus Onthomorpha intestinigallinarum]|uniref:UvrABC system protein C n=1 Tax=Candidatus Onthomorpha intestinigallinarum TaxID=2840880 RepID=A0A9D1RHR2_9BACT|nr:excinuclease ABC subunit UvrC [Candidatus Onthomorpha intestinigallinarum]